MINLMGKNNDLSISSSMMHRYQKTKIYFSSIQTKALGHVLETKRNGCSERSLDVNEIEIAKRNA